MQADIYKRDFQELTTIRQSVRAYESFPVEKNKIIKCLETARLSPSANNAQPWKFIILDNKEIKNKVASSISILGMNKFAKQAPVIIVVVLEKRDIISSLAGTMQDKDYSYIDIGIAVNQFCLQATNIGLSTCIIGFFTEKEKKTNINIPQNKRVPIVITMGYSKKPVEETNRKPLAEISSWNKY